MEQLTLSDVHNLLKSNQINYYNLYNVDVSVAQHYTADYYKNNKHDTIDKNQNLSKIYTDIEVFTNFEGFSDENITTGEHIVSCITIYSTKSNKYTSFFLLKGDSFNCDDFNERLKNDKYINEDINYELLTFTNESELLTKYWQTIQSEDPLILTGYNSDNFDYPYLYNRTVKLHNSKQIADALISKFGIINLSYNGVLSIPEYTIADILYLMKPRDEGGLNYGKKQDMYSLDYTSKKVLGISKVEHNESLDELYINKPKEYLYYNLVDVILSKLLDDKFQHINLHNIIRRVVKCNYSTSLHGVSLMYDSFILYQLMNDNKFVRYGISNEKGKSIDKNNLKHIPLIKNKKTVINPINIEDSNYRSFTSKYSGAYVKTPHPKIINDGSLIIDLDATSLYPSMILQHNISFDVFIGNVLNPPVYKLLEFLEINIGKVNEVPEQLCTNILKFATDHVEGGSYLNKSQAINHIYYLTLYLIDKLLKSKIPIKNIYNPSNDTESILLKTYLIPLIDIINIIHSDSTMDYNNFIYDFLFNKDILTKYPIIYLYQNPFNSNSKIVKTNQSEAVDFLKQNCFTINGSVFNKHEDKLGMFTNIITDLITMRNHYKTERDKYKEGDFKYNQLNALQNSIKVATNSIYGIFGLATFRYSSHYLAQSITSQGRLVNKIAQYITENNLKLKFN